MLQIPLLPKHVRLCRTYRMPAYIAPIREYRKSLRGCISLQKEKTLHLQCLSFCLFRQRPTFPGSFPPSIIGTTELNFRVRDGNGCDLCVITTEFRMHIFSYRAHSKLNNASHFKMFYNSLNVCLISQSFRSSPRSISIAQLNTLLHLHLRPINDVVYIRPYLLVAMGYLILRGASRLDAFSVYPVPTWLLCRAIG